MPSKKPLINRDNFLEKSFDGLLIFFLLSRIFSIITKFYGCSGDIDLYNLVAINISYKNLTPYVDFNFEYPIFSIIPILLAKFITSDIYNLRSYIDSFAIIMLIFDSACLFFGYRLCKIYFKFTKAELNQFIFLYTLFGLTLSSFILCRLDLIVALMLIVVILIYANNRKNLLNIFLIFGFFYKIVTIFVLPISLLFYSFKNKSFKKSFADLILNSLLYLSLFIGALIFAEYLFAQKFISNIYYHHQRGIQIESTYGSLLLIKDLFFGNPESVYFNFGSFNITANNFISNFAKFFGFFVLFLFYFSLFAFVSYKKRLDKNLNLSFEVFFEAVLLTFLIILSFQRVLSMQFFIWIMPLMAIYIIRNKSNLILIIILVIYFLNFYIFPTSYNDLIAKQTLEILILLIRNILLVLLTGIIAHNFFKKLSTNDKG